MIIDCKFDGLEAWCKVDLEREEDRMTCGASLKSGCI